MVRAWSLDCGNRFLSLKSQVKDIINYTTPANHVRNFCKEKLWPLPVLHVPFPSHSPHTQKGKVSKRKISPTVSNQNQTFPDYFSVKHLF